MTRTIARPNLLAYINAFEVLLVSPRFSREELVDATGWHDATAARLLKQLRQRKMIHVCAWLPDTMDRDAIPVYALGAKKDAPRKKLTPAQRSQRWRANQRELRQQENMKGLFK